MRGLTTASVVWMTAAIGMACAAGLALLAILATLGHFIVVLVYPRLAAALPRSRYMGIELRLVYEDGRGILRDILAESTQHGFSIVQVETRQREGDGTVAVTLEIQGQPTADPLTTTLTELPGVIEVASTDLARRGD